MGASAARGRAATGPADAVGHRRRTAVGAFRLLVAISLATACGADVVGIAGSPGSGREPVAASTASRPAPAMPDLVGRDVRRAQQNPRLADLTVEGRDYSPLDRLPTDHGRWTVVATLPAAGAPLPAMHATVWLYVLRASEVAWYRTQAAMPRLQRGARARSVLARVGPLAGMRELVEFRFADGTAPAGLSNPPLRVSVGGPVSGDLQVEPRAERRARQRLVPDFAGYGTVVVGSLPGRRDPVRLGRVLVVTVRPAHAGRGPYRHLPR